MRQGGDFYIVDEDVRVNTGAERDGSRRVISRRLPGIEYVTGLDIEVVEAISVARNRIGSDIFRWTVCCEVANTLSPPIP